MAGPLSAASAPRDAASSRSIEVVALVASAGGLDAVVQVLRGVPSDLGVAIVVALHLGGGGSRLVEILERRAGLPVGWARHGQRIETGCVTVCPPRSVLEILPDGTCTVAKFSRAAAARPLDALLGSLGDSYGVRALGVVLTGMGSDGAAGRAR